MPRRVASRRVECDLVPLFEVVASRLDEPAAQTEPLLTVQVLDYAIERDVLWATDDDLCHLEFLLSITLTSTAARPVSAAIAFLTGSTQFQVPIGTISAALVTITAPLIILVVIFQKRIVAGLTAGAVKG